LISKIGLTRLLEMLVRSFQDEDENNQQEIVKNLSKENMIWAYQGFEILSSFKD